jgi:hypothetical protein
VNDCNVQLSVAVGDVQFATASQLAPVAVTLIFAGQPLITGNSVSVTVTVNVHVAVLPAASVAVYVTVVVPIGNTSPGLWVELSVAPGQLSNMVGNVQFATALH